MAVAAAAAYPQYSPGMITPVTSGTFLEQYRSASILNMISATDYMGEIRNQGDTVIILRDPDVVVNRYVKGGGIRRQHLMPSTVSLTVDHACNFSVHMDMIDEHQIAQFAAWKTRVLQAAAASTAELIDTQLLSALVQGVDPSNQGNNAGVESQQYTLGSYATPLTVNSGNIVTWLTNISQTLTEQNVPADQRFVLLPIIAQSALIGSDMANAAHAGTGQSLMFKPLQEGAMYIQSLGLNLVFTNRIKGAVNTNTGTTTYNVLAGRKNATAAITQLTGNRVIELHETFGRAYEGFTVYGHGVVHPESLALSHVDFS